MLASAIISRARTVLTDSDGSRWTDSELLGWVNDGQRAIALVRPDASVADTAVSLVAGTKQSIPANGLRLLDVMRNMNADGSGGRSVRNVDRDILDTQDFNWHSTTQAQVIKNFVYDNRNPKIFYVYPPAAVGAILEIIYSQNPTDCDTTSSTIFLADIYAEPLLNYVLYRAYSKDAEFAANAQLSASYLAVFNSMLGIKTKKDASYSPDLNSKGASPSAVAIQMGGV